MSDHLTTVPTTKAHALALALTMRKADVEELWAAGHTQPAEALTMSLDMSLVTQTVMLGDKVVCIFGVGYISLLSIFGIPWMMGSDLVDAHPVEFARKSLEYRDDMLAEYDMLRNFVDARNTAAVTWLKWLGFTLYDPIPYGVDQLPFRLFELKASDNV